jgi:hypothetical protein
MGVPALRCSRVLLRPILNGLAVLAVAPAAFGQVEVRVAGARPNRHAPCAGRIVEAWSLVGAAAHSSRSGNCQNGGWAALGGRMSKKRWEIAFLVAALSALPGSALAWGPLRSLPDQTVPTPIGDLTFTKLRCDQAMGSAFVWGAVTNNTGRAWAALSMAVSIHDKNGDVAVSGAPGQEKGPALLLRVTNLGVGQSQNFSVHGFGRSDKATDAVTLKVLDGDYPVGYKLELVKPVAAPDGRFETDGYSISFVTLPTALHFSLRNKGDGPIRIDWNSVALVDTAGRSHGVIHTGVKLVDRTAPKAPTIVPPGASIEDEITPVDNVDLVDGNWVTQNLLPSGFHSGQVIGKDLTVFLPLDVDGKTENRSFVFHVSAN